jgi:succinate-semialdehyde dehydrogenase/glutarate-semialdehyde dehydrogenase
MTKLQSINPFTEELNWEFETLEAYQVDTIIKKAHEAYKTWKNTHFSYRKELFFKLADILEDDIDACSRLETIEMGMLNHVSKAGLLKTANLIRWFANNGEEILKEREYETEWLKVREMYDPIWVIFWVAPWNFPFNQLLRAAVPNILAWNTQIYKHSSNVPMIAIKIEELFEKAGFPAWVYTNVFVSSSLSEHIISNKYIAWVNLTGSEAAWSAVWSLAWKYLKPSVLELGWNDAFIVLENSDLNKVIELAVNGRTRNWWQACNASKRFLVPDTLYEVFLEKYKIAMESLIIWDPMDESTQLQPLSSEKAIKDMENQVARAISSGARLITGWKRIERKWFFFEPTILADVTPSVSSFNEEIFGPVASVMKYKTIEEAVELANWSDFGLSAVVVWNDEKEAIEIWKKLDWGMIFINMIAWSRASLPFGWVRKSGYGKENGPDGLKAFTNKKVIVCE